MASDGMFLGIFVDDDGNPLPAIEEDFTNITARKFKEDTFTCLGFNVLPGVTNNNASDFASECFKQPDETIADHKKRMSGWHNTWGKLLGALITTFNTPSAEIMKIAPPTKVFWAIGDPTKFLTEILNPIKAKIEPIIGMSINDYLQSRLAEVFAGLTDLVKAVLLIPTATKKGFNKLIDFILSLFPDMSKEIIKKIKKALKEEKDKIVGKVIALLAGIPSFPDIVLPSLENLLEYFGVEIDLDIELTLPNLRAMIYPGIPELSVPQGILLIFMKIILSFIEIVTDLFTNLSSFLFAIGEMLQLILQLKFLEAIMLILQKIIEFLMEKIISISPEIVGSSSFLCTLMAFLELGAKIFCITLLGHLLGPGLVFQTMASLVMSI
ncbi:hypothetical protein HOD02_06155 [bacterium]|nr:hypothetical protein [bacterium]